MCVDFSENFKQNNSGPTWYSILASTSYFRSTATCLRNSEICKGPEGTRGWSLSSSCRGKKPLFSSDNWRRFSAGAARRCAVIPRPISTITASSNTIIWRGNSHRRSLDVGLCCWQMWTGVSNPAVKLSNLEKRARQSVVKQGCQWKAPLARYKVETTLRQREEIRPSEIEATHPTGAELFPFYSQVITKTNSKVCVVYFLALRRWLLKESTSQNTLDTDRVSHVRGPAYDRLFKQYGEFQVLGKNFLLFLPLFIFPLKTSLRRWRPAVHPFDKRHPPILRRISGGRGIHRK